MGVPLVRLDEIAEVRLGRQRSPKNHTGPEMRPYVRAANVGWGGLSLDDVKTMNFTDAEMAIYRLRPGDILLGEASGSPAEVGKPAIWNGEIDECAFQNTLLRVRSRGAHPRYLLHFFKHEAMTGNFAAASRGVGIRHLGRESLAGTSVPLPSLTDQRRIASILDHAEALELRRREGISLLDCLTQATFLEGFGIPAENRRGYPLMRLGDLAEKFSDGPFGSNLKSSHYTSRGIRVVRLQNIGVGRFLDSDRAYISEEHFQTLRRHACLPGDILVGTLGDPNLRACIQPDWLRIAINKADCVQIRVNPVIALPSYVCALVNQPSVLKMARSIVYGQTRARVSMGRLRDLMVPVAPLESQLRFVNSLRNIDSITRSYEANIAKYGELFTSLQRRAFAGKL